MEFNCFLPPGKYFDPLCFLSKTMHGLIGVHVHKYVNTYTNNYLWNGARAN